MTRATYQRVISLSEEYNKKVSQLQAKGIVLAEIMRTAIDLYWNAEFKPKEVPKELLEKTRTLLRKRLNKG